MLEWFDSTATLAFTEYYFLSERDGMVDMSGLDSGDGLSCGFKSRRS